MPSVLPGASSTRLRLSRLHAGIPLTTKTISKSSKMSRQHIQTLGYRQDNAPSGVTTTTIKVGDKIPTDASFYVLDRQADAPKRLTAQDVFAGKNVVLFGLPGAFTSVCSSKHAPGFNAKYDEFKQQGVDRICCTSVNDAYVMASWAEQLGIDPNRVMMLADGDGSFHEQTGLTQQLEGLGIRARRYSMYLEDGVVRIINVDEPGPMSYKVSGPDHMLGDMAAMRKSERNVG